MYRLKVRDDADGYYRQYRGEVMGEFASFDAANDIRRAMINGAEFEVIQEEG